jgi:hypothetical protein
VLFVQRTFWVWCITRLLVSRARVVPARLGAGLGLPLRGRASRLPRRVIGTAERPDAGNTGISFTAKAGAMLCDGIYILD